MVFCETNNKFVVFFSPTAADADGDDVRCRWANGESGGVTQPSKNVLSVNSVNIMEDFQYSQTD